MDADASMGLFANGREANLASSIAMIEDVLVELGHFLNECRTEAPPALAAWRVVKGSAAVHIALLAREEYTHLRVESVLMTADDAVDAPALHRELLRLNSEALVGAAFAAVDDQVRLVAERSTLDLDRSEVRDIIERIQRYADRYDDQLVERFGGRRGGG